VNQWASYATAGETANQPKDLAQNTPANSSNRIIMADNVWYHNQWNQWAFNHSVGGGTVSGWKISVPSTVIPVAGVNRLYTDGHVEWKGYTDQDRANIGQMTYPERCSQVGNGYPSFY